MTYVAFYPTGCANQERAELSFRSLAQKHELKVIQNDHLAVTFPYGWKHAETFLGDYRALIMDIQAEARLAHRKN